MKKILLTAVMAAGALAVQAQNPYLPLWEHLPDGEPRVFEDPDNPGRKRAYIIGSHDTHYTKYCGNDVRMWSAPVEDLTQWRDEGPLFSWFTGGQWDMIIMDELNYALKFGLVSLNEVLSLLDSRPSELHLVITGRDAPPAIIDRADLVTEMKLIKHPYQQGIRAQMGIEY